MSKEYGYKHLEVYQKAVGLLDAFVQLQPGGLLPPLLAGKAAEALDGLIEALEAWPQDQKRESFFRSRRIFHRLKPLIDAGARQGLFSSEETARLDKELDSVSMMLCGLAKKEATRGEAAAA